MHKTFFIGLIVIPIFYLLDYFGLISMPEGRPLEIIQYVIFWNLVIALPIHNDHYLKTNKKAVTFSILKMIHT